MKPERRQAGRSRLFQRASIVFNGGQSLFDCAIRNRSETGAMIRLADWTALPAIFDLGCADGSVRVRQCWRSGDDVGVVFVTAEDCQTAQLIDLAAFRASRTQRPSPRRPLEGAR